jgi:hypothetical protein
LGSTYRDHRTALRAAAGRRHAAGGACGGLGRGQPAVDEGDPYAGVGVIGPAGLVAVPLVALGAVEGASGVDVVGDVRELADQVALLTFDTDNYVTIRQRIRNWLGGTTSGQCLDQLVAELLDSPTL